MFILHMDVMVKTAAAEFFYKTFRDQFHPLVSKQPGFCATELLFARSGEKWTHRLVLSFKDESFQRLWVDTEAHREVWEKIEPSVLEWAVSVFETEGAQ